MTDTQNAGHFHRMGALSRIMNIGVLLLDQSGEAEFASPLACELLGSVGDADVNRRWRDLKARFNVDLGAAKTSTPLRVIADLDENSGAHSLRMEIYALEEKACTGYLILMRDRRMIEALDTDLLMASQTLSMVHLHGALAHDLRAPLNAMQITLELLSDSLTNNSTQALRPENGGDARQQRYVRVLREELSRLNRGLQFMLDQNVPLAQKSNTFDVCEAVKEISALLGPQARRQRVELDVLLPPYPLMLSGYRDRMKQGLLNIAINALEAMPNGGDLTVKVHARDGRACIEFLDRGPGIPEDVLNEIYQMYFTTKRTGRGIGLYVTRLVVESHGGEILVGNRSDGGASFTVTLPLSLASERTDAKATYG